MLPSKAMLKFLANISRQRMNIECHIPTRGCCLGNQGYGGTGQARCSGLALVPRAPLKEGRHEENVEVQQFVPQMMSRQSEGSCPPESGNWFLGW